MAVEIKGKLFLIMMCVSTNRKKYQEIKSLFYIYYTI